MFNKISFEDIFIHVIAAILTILVWSAVGFSIFVSPIVWLFKKK